jgi:hypothetical protein
MSALRRSTTFRNPPLEKVEPNQPLEKVEPNCNKGFAPLWKSG